jgi:polysaccharide biosynthesis/export protein
MSGRLRNWVFVIIFGSLWLCGMQASAQVASSPEAGVLSGGVPQGRSNGHSSPSPEGVFPAYPRLPSGNMVPPQFPSAMTMQGQPTLQGQPVVPPIQPRADFSPASNRPVVASPIEVSFRELSMTPDAFQAGIAGIKDDPRIPADAARSEKTDRRRASDGQLRQFGYSLFEGPGRSVSTFAPVDDVPVGPDYLLGPGDNLRIHVWGAMESAMMGTVDRTGVIYLPTAGPVRVWGLSFSQAERLIRDRLSRYYRGFQTSVTMGRLRTIRVYVVGETAQPGAYTVSSLATMVNALFAAGGPEKVGSLRTIVLKRNHHTVGTFDLYDFLLKGDKTRDFRLESGDTIFVPPVGATVAITGEVKRPAIYELKGQTTVHDLIEMAGGLTPRSYLKRVQLLRTKPNAEREVIDLDFTAVNGSAPASFQLRNGDLVRIYETDPRIYNTVVLTGAVKYPGEYQTKPHTRLSDILPEGSTYPEAFIDGIEVARLRTDLKTDVFTVDLRKSWREDPEHDIFIIPGDVISVRSRDVRRSVFTLSGEVKRPGQYVIRPGERLSSVLTRAGGFTEYAYPLGAVFTRLNVAREEKKRLDRFVQEHEALLLVGAKQDLNPTSLEEEQGRMLAIEQKRALLRATADRVVLGRVVLHLTDDLAQFAASPSDVELQDGDSLNVPRRPVSVMVLGSVRNPTAVLFKNDEDVQYYVNRAGGMSEAANEKEMYVLKADGSAITGFLRLRELDPGDAVIVPPRTQKKDLSWVSDVAKIAGNAALGLAALVSIAR